MTTERGRGWAVVALAPCSVLTEMLVGLAATWHAAEGERQLALELGDADVYAAVFGLMLVVSGRVMGEAARLAEENEGFV